MDRFRQAEDVELPGQRGLSRRVAGGPGAGVSDRPVAGHVPRPDDRSQSAGRAANHRPGGPPPAFTARPSGRRDGHHAAGGRFARRGGLAARPGRLGPRTASPLGRRPGATLAAHRRGSRRRARWPQSPGTRGARARSRRNAPKRGRRRAWSAVADGPTARRRKLELRSSRGIAGDAIPQSGHGAEHDRRDGPGPAAVPRAPATRTSRASIRTLSPEDSII